MKTKSKEYRQREKREGTKRESGEERERVKVRCTEMKKGKKILQLC